MTTHPGGEPDETVLSEADIQRLLAARHSRTDD
jgi:hypothetical protein